MTNTTVVKTRVWDLPLRVFHWTLLFAVIGLFITSKVGGDAMKAHFYLGYLVLALLMFRIVWGFLGSKYARFSSFPPNPLAAWRTFKGAVSSHLGHNPMGALSVYALLASLSFQAVSGLFSNDDIASEGPLVVKVSKEFSDQITGLHKLNEKVIMLLVFLHLAAILYYRFGKKEPLIKAMVTGDKPNAVGEAADDGASTRVRGLAVFAVCAAIVWFLVSRT